MWRQSQSVEDEAGSRGWGWTTGRLVCGAGEIDSAQYHTAGRLTQRSMIPKKIRITQRNLYKNPKKGLNDEKNRRLKISLDKPFKYPFFKKSVFVRTNVLFPCFKIGHHSSQLIEIAKQRIAFDFYSTSIFSFDCPLLEALDVETIFKLLFLEVLCYVVW